MADFDEQVATAVRCLKGGGVAAIPTDTLYGLAADIFNPAALDRVFAIKERPSGLAMPVLLSDWDQLGQVARDVPARARDLAGRFWPGPLTLVVAKADKVPGLLTADGPTVAVRIPGHPVPRQMASQLGGPITGTSANLSGGPDVMTLEQLKAQLGSRVDYTVTCGPAPQGTGSTVVDITGDCPKLLREGAIPFGVFMEAWE